MNAIATVRPENRCRSNAPALSDTPPSTLPEAFRSEAFAEDLAETPAPAAAPGRLPHRWNVMPLPDLGAWRRLSQR